MPSPSWRRSARCRPTRNVNAIRAHAPARAKHRRCTRPSISLPRRLPGDLDARRAPAASECVCGQCADAEQTQRILDAMNRAAGGPGTGRIRTCSPSSPARTSRARESGKIVSRAEEGRPRRRRAEGREIPRLMMPRVALHRDQARRRHPRPTHLRPSRVCAWVAAPARQPENRSGGSALAFAAAFEVEPAETPRPHAARVLPWSFRATTSSCCPAAGRRNPTCGAPPTSTWWRSRASWSQRRRADATGERVAPAGRQDPLDPSGSLRRYAQSCMGISGISAARRPDRARCRLSAVPARRLAAAGALMRSFHAAFSEAAKHLSTARRAPRCSRTQVEGGSWALGAFVPDVPKPGKSRRSGMVPIKDVRTSGGCCWSIWYPSSGGHPGTALDEGLRRTAGGAAAQRRARPAAPGGHARSAWVGLLDSGGLSVAFKRLDAIARDPPRQSSTIRHGAPPGLMVRAFG